MKALQMLQGDRSQSGSSCRKIGTREVGSLFWPKRLVNAGAMARKDSRPPSASTGGPTRERGEARAEPSFVPRLRVGLPG